MPFSESRSRARAATTSAPGGRDADDDRGGARPQHVPGEADRARASRRPRRRGRRRPGTTASTASTGSVPAAGGDGVGRARGCVASASLAASRSTATMRPAPASRAAATTCSPTPPQPTTHTRLPGADPAALRTAPTAVTTPQPSSDACHSGSPRGSGTAAPAGTTQRSAKHETKLKCCTRAAVGVAQARACRPGACRPTRRAAAVSHSVEPPGRGRRAHAPQDGTKQNATGSPGATCATPSPDRLDDARALVARARSAGARRRGGRRPGAGRSGRRRRRRRARAPRPPAGGSSSSSHDLERRRGTRAGRRRGSSWSTPRPSARRPSGRGRDLIRRGAPPARRGRA